MQKKNIFFLVIALCAVAIFLVIRSKNSAGGDSAEAQYYEVKKGNLHIAVTEGGTLEAVKEVLVKNPLSGNSKIVYIVKEGIEVNKGDLLVELDAAEMKERKKKIELEIVNDRSELVTSSNNLLIEQSTVDSEVSAAKRAITFAKMDLEKFIKLDKQQQLRNAESTISTALDSYKLTQQRYDWSKKLAAKGYETKSQVDRDRLDVSSKLKSLETARSKQKMLKLYDLPKQEAELKSKVTEAEKKYERVVKQGESKITRSKANNASKENKLKLNLERLAETEEKLKNTKLFAPVSGLILYGRSSMRSRLGPIEEGASVSKNRVLIKIPSIKKMKVVVSIPEFHINKIKVGQTAHITIDSIPNKRFAALVSKVSVIPESQGWLGSRDKTYRVEIKIEDPLPGVKPSISAKAEITIKDLTDVISVPLQAINTEQGKLYCYVNEDGENIRKPVKIGMMSNSFAEIKEGLKPGDQILLTQPSE